MKSSASVEELVQAQFFDCKFHIPDNQWTVLAGIALRRCNESPFEVVSVGAGLKCLPLADYDDQLLDEALVHDCHGEILAKRAFMCYLLDQMSKHDNLGDDGIYVKVGDKFRLKPSVTFHMYVSHAPCGDASMRSIVEDNADEEHTARKRAKYDSTAAIRRGREDFSAEPGTARTKPGRLDAPFSACMSCSDKIASWTVLGLQGALLLNLLDDPVYLTSITVGDCFDRKSLDRAIISRVCPKDVRPPFFVQPPQIEESILPFKHCKSPGQLPCPESHAWFHGCIKAETLVRGRKKGSAPPKDNQLPVKSSSFMSKRNIFNRFKAISNGKHESYSAAKRTQKTYKDAKFKLLDLPCFKGWLRGRFV